MRPNYSTSWLLAAAVGGLSIVLTVLNVVADNGARAIVIGAVVLFFGAVAAIVAELRASRLHLYQVTTALLPAPPAEPAQLSMDLLQDWHEPTM